MGVRAKDQAEGPPETYEQWLARLAGEHTRPNGGRERLDGDPREAPLPEPPDDWPAGAAPTLDGPASNGSRPQPSRVDRWSAHELMAATFPDPEWTVAGLIPEGLTLLVGASKVGKSWLALQLCWAVAAGGIALGRFNVAARPVLYLALEDTPRRLKARLRSLFGDERPPDRFDLWTDWDPDDVTDWARRHPRGLIVVDVLAYIRPPSTGNEQQYDRDYRSLLGLKAVADETATAVVVLHHDRKAGSDDWLHTVSGTQGLTGAADGILLLRRARSQADGVLHATGRDIEDAELALRFDGGAWTALDGPASDYELGDTRQQIVRLLRDRGPMRPKQVSDTLGIDHDLTRQTLRRMVDGGQLDTDGQGLYLPLSHQSQVSQHHTPL